jgi:DNA repair exonuclease SbcCD nuclease subunit
MINKILYITDLHIKVKNVSEVKALKQKIESFKNVVSHIIIGGDVINNCYADNNCYYEAKDLIKVCSKITKTYVLVGNHDYIDKNQFLTNNHWMNDLKKWENVFIVDRVTTIMFKCFQVTCVPYVPNGRFVEALNMSKTQWKKSSLIFAHQEIKGCRIGNKISSVGDFWDPSYPTLISGHIHDAQKINNNVIYPGSTINQGQQNDQQKIWIINTKFTENDGFEFNMEYSTFKTTKKTLVTAKTFDDLFDIKDKTKKLADVILIIQEYDNNKISEIKQSKIYKYLVTYTHIVCFAD